MSHGPLPAVYGPWVLSCTDCCHLPKQMYTTVYPASHRPGKYVQTFGTFEVSLSATWGYQPVYDSSQVGRWHLANKESGCRVGGESIAEPCRLVSDEPLTCFFFFFYFSSLSERRPSDSLAVKSQLHIHLPLNAFTMSSKIETSVEKWGIKVENLVASASAFHQSSECCKRL